MKTTNALHFTPQDGFFGDPMPLFHDGVYHVYYTKRYQDDAICWGHISSTDLISWQEHPDPFTPGAVRSPLKTGCVIFAEGKYHAYYAGPVDDPKKLPILHAVSDNGIYFDICEDITVPQPLTDEYYRTDGTWRDPHVFYDDEAHCYRMVFCTRRPEIAGKPICFQGSVGNAVSDDLYHWTLLPPFDESEICSSTECPDIFKTENQWIMMYYWHETRFRVADSLKGPWRRTEVLSPDGMDFMAAKRMSDGNRHISLGWLPRRDCDCAKRTWGGNMLFPRELSFEADGTPISKFAPEIKKLFTKKKEFLPAVSTGEWTVSDGTIKGDSPYGGSYALLNEELETYLFSADVNISKPEATLIFFAHVEKGVKEGYQLIFDAADGLLRLREHYIWDQRGDIVTMPLKVTAGTPFHVDILVNRDILEVCVDNKRTMVSRMLDHTKGKIALSVMDGAVSLENIDFREIE